MTTAETRQEILPFLAHLSDDIVKTSLDQGARFQDIITNETFTSYLKEGEDLGLTSQQIITVLAIRCGETVKH